MSAYERKTDAVWTSEPASEEGHYWLRPQRTSCLPGDWICLLQPREAFSDNLRSILPIPSAESLASAEARVEALTEALREIEKWELPRIPNLDGGGTVSYGVAYGSNGERDYIRGVARRALLSSGSPAPREPVLGSEDSLGEEQTRGSVPALPSQTAVERKGE